MSVLIQNFAIPADNDLTIELDITPLMSMDTLAGSNVFWNVYEQQYGVPVPNVDPVITKSTLSPGGDITILDSPTMSALVTVLRADTVGLLRSYYHETTVRDITGNISTVNCGIVTITPTENRP